MRERYKRDLCDALKAYFALCVLRRRVIGHTAVCCNNSPNNRSVSGLDYFSVSLFDLSSAFFQLLNQCHPRRGLTVRKTRSIIDYGLVESR